MAVEEYGYAVPDPKDPDIVFGGKVTRYDRRTTQNANVSPTGGGRGGGPRRRSGRPRRAVRTQPVVFSAADPHVLFFGNNLLWKTIDGGLNWTQISPDVARTDWDLPKSVGKYMPARVQHGAPNARVDLLDRAVAARRQSHLVRHRRRQIQTTTDGGPTGPTSRRPR